MKITSKDYRMIDFVGISFSIVPVLTALRILEETRIYNRFAEISKSKLAVIVTHRLGSVKLADRILVMHQGKLVEQGTHAELITNGGEYARLYAAQEQWYK